MSDLNVKIADQWTELLPERGLYWPTEKTLFISDTHFGKAATFRAFGVRVPEGAMVDDLARLTRVIARKAAERLIVLGDLLHASAGRSSPALDAVAKWRAAHPQLAIWLVRGNHDRRAGDPPPAWGITVHDPDYVLAPFTLHHEPIYPSRGSYTLAGHLHPAVRLTGVGRQALKAPCFWLTKKLGVLPAFASFAGLEIIRPGPTDRIYVVGEKHVTRLGPEPEKKEKP